MRMEVIENGRSIPKEQHKAVLVASTERFHARSLQRRLERSDKRYAHAPERQSVAKAMLAVEEKFVKAMWVLERALPKEGAEAYSNRNGLEYLRERVDHFAAGQWQDVAPRPAVPGAREIDEALKVKAWLGHLDATHARVLSLGAMSKRGDAGRRVRWIVIRSRLPELKDYSERSLRHFYTEALRTIVAELTLAGGRG